MTMTSGGMVLPRATEFSRFCFTLRSSASCSGGVLGVGGLLEAGDLGDEVGLLGQDRVEAGARQALDEQPDAPVGKLQHPHDRGDGADLVQVLGRGVSFCPSRCATSMMIRCSARAASTALIDFSRETERGRMMNGKDDDVLQGQDGKDVGDRELGVPFRRYVFFFDLGHGSLSLRLRSPRPGISISFSRRSGPAEGESREGRSSVVSAWWVLTGRGSGIDFTKAPK